MRTKVFYLLALIVMTAACWLLATRLFGALNLGWFIVLALAGGLVTFSLLWVARNANARAWIYVGLLTLAGLVVPTYTQAEFESVLIPLLVQATALVIAALLLYAGLCLYREWRNAGALKGVDAQVQRSTPASCYPSSCRLGRSGQACCMRRSSQHR